MRFNDYMSLSGSPADEQCVCVGEGNYLPAMHKETIAFKHLIERTFPEIIARGKVALKIVKCPHDFGSYYDLQVLFNDEDEQSSNDAIHIENNLPEKWDLQGIEDCKAFRQV